MNLDKLSLIEKICYEIIDESIKDLLINFKFLDLALSTFNFSVIDSTEITEIATDGSTIYFNADFLIKRFKLINTNQGSNYCNITRMIMHSLIHCLFHHSKVFYKEGKVIENLYDLACDICCEYIIDDFENPIFGNKRSQKEIEKTNVYIKIKNNLLKKFNNGNFVVNNIYNYLLTCTMEQLELYQRLFVIDQHYNWKYQVDNDDKQNENQEKVKEETRDKVLEYTKTGIEILEKIKGSKSSQMHNHLKVATSTKYDYKKFLRRFMEFKEVLAVDVDSFDPIYYTLGLSLYKNIPLIEYNEVKEEYKIQDLVLVIDTSASTYGRLVSKFISETWAIISQIIGSGNQENKLRLHIIQSDSVVQDYKLIENNEQFKDYIDHFEVIGGGGTDFRPALEYIDVMREEQKFENLKGVLYFTDGFGEYPNKALDFETVFVFCIDDEFIVDDISVPSWAMKLILSKNDLLED